MIKNKPEFIERIYKIFISSTNCLKEYRNNAKDCIQRHGHIHIDQDLFSPSPDLSETEISKYIEQSDIVVIIAGNRYGSITNTGKSFVEFEYEIALQNKKPVIGLIFEDNNKKELKQELFIQRLSKTICGKFCDLLSFEIELNKLFNAILQNPLRNSGYIKFSYYQKKIHKFKNAIYIIRNKLYRETSLKNSINMLTYNYEGFPVLLDIIYSKLANFNHEINSLTIEEGYTPNKNELKLIIDKLFSPTLQNICETIIISKQKAILLSDPYRCLLEDKKFYSKRCSKFLIEGGKIQRIYYCESLVNAVNEEWFSRIIVNQLFEGVKIILKEIDNSSEDFGIFNYENESYPEKYILFTCQNTTNKELSTTKLLVDPNQVRKFCKKFESQWKETDIIEIDHKGFANKHYEIDLYGEDSLNCIFNNNIMLRNMIPLNFIDKRLTDENVQEVQQVRFFQIEYANAIKKYILELYPNIENILYFGDSFYQDGNLIRNLQSINVDVFAFVCDASLNLSNILVKSIYYSSKWTDAINLIHRVKQKISMNTLVVFNLDNTFWAPKDMHEKPLKNTRLSAIKNLISQYIKTSKDNINYMQKVKERAMFVYNEMSLPKFQDIIKYNEDYKAIISIFIGLGFYKGGINYAINEPEDIYLEGILNQYLNIDNGIFEFLREVFSEALWNPKSEKYCKQNGIFSEMISKDIRELAFNIQNNIPTPFKKFRSLELSDAYKRANDRTIDIEDRLTINKTMWDIAQFFKKQKIHLLCLSDRPDEATYNNKQSLLSANMQVRGMSIEKELKEIDFINLTSY